MSAREKPETRFGQRWIRNFRQQCRDKGHEPLCQKIVGSAFQETGISDWLICYTGRFVAIEFKYMYNDTTATQRQFIRRVIEAGGIGVIIDFVKDGDYGDGQELEFINKLKGIELHENLLELKHYYWSI